MNSQRRDFLFQLILAGMFPFPGSFGSQSRKEAEINATDTSVNWPEGLAIDSRDQLYIAEAAGKRVLSLDTKTGKIRVVLGGGGVAPAPGSPAQSVELSSPTAVAINGTRLWVADRLGPSVIEVDLRENKIVQVFRRNARQGFDAPSGLAIGPAGEVYVADWVVGSNPPDSRDHGVFKLDPGSPVPSRVTGLNGPIKISPQLLFPRGLAFGSGATLYVAAQDSNKIVECDLLQKRVKTLIDSGPDERQAFQKLQESPNTNVFQPRMLAISGTTLYFTESAPWVRAIDLRTRTIRVVAGSRAPGYSGDGGPSVKARMAAPFGLAIDSQGNLFISDSQDNRIRRVDAKSGTISTVAGNGRPEHPMEPRL